jgi:hypothetical protein
MMGTFLLLFVGRPAQPQADDPETQAYNAKWVDWIGGLVGEGRLVAGQPLEWSGKVVSRDATSDLVLADPDIGGFMVVRADSMEDAVAAAQTAPHMELGGTTIVRPGIEVPGPA